MQLHVKERSAEKKLCKSKMPSCLYQEETAACLPFVQLVLWISSSFSSPQAPRHFEIERKIINLLLLFSYFQFENKNSGVYQPNRHTFTLSSCKLCHIYTPRYPFKRTPRLEIDKDLLRRGMKTTHSYTLRVFFSSSCPLSLLLFRCCLFPCTASWLAKPFFNNISAHL